MGVTSIEKAFPKKAEDVPLIPMGEFKLAAKKILSNTKAESDRDMARFQASNLKRRQARKHG